MADYEPDEALVEVAARALFTRNQAEWQRKVQTWDLIHEGSRAAYRDTARAVLREAGPMLLARGWTDGYRARVLWIPGQEEPTNPYRDGGAS